MAETPKRPPRTAPLRAGANVPAVTLEELNERIDQVIQNGQRAIGVLQGVSASNTAKTESNTRLLRWVIVFAVVAVFSSGLAIKASSDAANAQAQICRATQQNRDLLKAVVVASYNQSGGGGLQDLRTLAHYNDLDPATKGWVDALQAAVSPGSQQNQSGDKNKNHVPDAIEKILNAEVCTVKPKTANRTIPIALGGAGVLVIGYGIWEWRRRRNDQPDDETAT
jgi:hypothetical protein